MILYRLYENTSLVVRDVFNFYFIFLVTCKNSYFLISLISRNSPPTLFIIARLCGVNE